MKKILIELAKILQLSLIACGIIILNKNALFGCGVIVWGFFFYSILRRETKIKKHCFTLMELVTVVIIVSVLISITMNLFGNIDKDKRDIQVLHSTLMDQQIRSLKYQTEIYKVSYDGLFTLPEESYGPVYLKGGVPVNQDGKPYLGCRLDIGEYFIRVNAFTGKLSFY